MGGRWRRTAAVALAAAVASFASAPAAEAGTTRTPGPAEDEGTVTLVLYHGEGCPHCAAEREWLVGLQGRHPELRVALYEVWYDEANRERLEDHAATLGFTPSGVPVTVVGERYWVGFNDTVADDVESTVAAMLTGGPPPERADAPIDVPGVGEVDLAGSSLLASTLVIGFVDGVNPCSLWALSMLLAIVLHSGSRRRVVAVGTTFLAVTAAMYALYIAGMYSVLDLLGRLDGIRVAVALVAAVFGAIHVKDYVALHRGISLSIPESRRPWLLGRMRSVASGERTLPAVLAGTVVLAVGVSLLETPCTAGLPLLWTDLLARAGVTTGQAIALFAAYMGVFLLDELLVLGAAVVTLRAARVQERHGRVLKLVSGVVMLALATAMLLAPAALQSLAGTAVVFGAASLVIVSVLAVDRFRQRRDETVS